MAGSSMQNVAKMFKSLATETKNCPVHGEYKSELMRYPGRPEPVWSGCMGCFQDEKKREEQEMAREARAQLEQSRIQSILGRAAIPNRFLHATLDNYNVEHEGQRKALASAKRYVENWEQNRQDGRSIIFMGDVGTGKTHLAIGIARHVLSLGQSAMFVRAHEAISRITETYSRDSTLTERQVLDGFRRPDLLIIDEVGRQRGSKNETMMLFEIINRRYDDEKPTIIVSNMDKAGIEQYIDKATIDRLRERKGIAIVCDWESYRSKV